MNRRRLLSMLPLASVALLAPAGAAPEPIDTRPTYRLSDYWTYAPGQAYLCEFHGVDHGVYTHGCQPVAFARDVVPERVAARLRPATADAIPFDLCGDCPMQHSNSNPHQHHDFRWIA